MNGYTPVLSLRMCKLLKSHFRSNPARDNIETGKLEFKEYAFILLKGTDYSNQTLIF